MGGQLCRATVWGINVRHFVYGIHKRGKLKNMFNFHGRVEKIVQLWENYVGNYVV